MGSYYVWFSQMFCTSFSENHILSMFIKRISEKYFQWYITFPYLAPESEDMIEMNDWFLVMHVLRSVAAHREKFTTKSVWTGILQKWKRIFSITYQIKKYPSVYAQVLLCGRYPVIFEAYIKQNKFCSYFTVLVILVWCHFTTDGK